MIVFFIIIDLIKQHMIDVCPDQQKLYILLANKDLSNPQTLDFEVKVVVMLEVNTYIYYLYK
jgi:hypothetical protein